MKQTILDQHDEILNKLNVVVKALETKEDNSFILLKEFESYVQFHFGYEETVMFQYGYPKMESHLMEHDYTISEIKSLIFWTRLHQLEEYPITVLRNIIITHVNVHDTELLNWIDTHEAT